MTHTCKQCKEDSEEGAMVQFEQDWVCAQCKTLYVQMLKEGVDELDVHDILEENGTRLSRLRRTVIRTYGIVYLLIAVFVVLIEIQSYLVEGITPFTYRRGLIFLFATVVAVGLLNRLRIMKNLMAIVTVALFGFLFREWESFLGLVFISVIPTVFLWIPTDNPGSHEPEIEQVDATPGGADR